MKNDMNFSTNVYWATVFKDFARCWAQEEKYKQKYNTCLRKEQVALSDWSMRYIGEMIGRMSVWSWLDCFTKNFWYYSVESGSIFVVFEQGGHIAFVFLKDRRIHIITKSMECFWSNT